MPAARAKESSIRPCGAIPLFFVPTSNNVTFDTGKNIAIMMRFARAMVSPATRHSIIAPLNLNNSFNSELS
jgi:hypothetical protein